MCASSAAGPVVRRRVRSLPEPSAIRLRSVVWSTSSTNCSIDEPMTCCSGVLDQLGEAAVAVDDVARLVSGDGAILHLLDQRAIRRIGAAQRVDALARPIGDEERVDFAVADRAQRLLGLGEARAQVIELCWLGAGTSRCIAPSRPLRRPEVEAQQDPVRV